MQHWTTASGGALDLKADELTLATGPTNVIARERVIAGSVGVCGLLGGADAANPRRRRCMTAGGQPGGVGGVR